MNKIEEFRKLAEDVSKCHICENMSAHPHLTEGEYLENDNHGLIDDTPYVNMWNLWQGNLESDIMVIGQDFGQLENSDSFVREHRLDKKAHYDNLKTK